MKSKSLKIKERGANRVFNILNYLFLTLSLIIVAVPLINVLASSFSSPSALITGKVRLLPIGFNLDAYAQILKSRSLLTGYKNSILYALVGTTINIIMTVMLAYPLSVKDFVGRKVIAAIFVFTMIFTAPLIPTYLNIRKLGLLDTMWAMVLPGAISVYNMIIARTYFINNIPDEMIEAAHLDGASDMQVMFQLVLPLSKSIIAVLVLFYAVTHWNSYFNAFIYLSSEDKLTLQVVLRNIMSTAKSLEEMANASTDQSQRAAMIEELKYAVIIVGSLPVVALYPFVQKHFVKGIMIGSLKG